MSWTLYPSAVVAEYAPDSLATKCFVTVAGGAVVVVGGAVVVVVVVGGAVVVVAVVGGREVVVVTVVVGLGPTVLLVASVPESRTPDIGVGC
jgi:hypothetical protein